MPTQKAIYTKKQKEALIRRFKAQTDAYLKEMRANSDHLVASAEQQVLRRLNSVSATLWNVRIKDVLQIERHHKPTVRDLLRDIKAMDSSDFLGSMSQNESSKAS